MTKRICCLLLALCLLIAVPALAEDAGETMPSLWQTYQGRFDFGTCAPQSVFRDIKTLKLVKQQFNILTPENELKPDSVLDVGASKKLVAETGDESQVAVRFDAAKPLLNFAKSGGLKVHGHVLFWHAQTPEAFFHEGYDAQNPFVTREVMLGRMDNYVREIMAYLDENYPGVVVSWDVLNEAIDDGTNKLRHSRWYEVVGEDFPNQAFAFARKYAPEGTLLYYNDYNTAMPGKLYGIIALLNTLIPEGNIDGYGFQMHHSVNYPTMQLITAAMEKIAALGLRLRVSEMDIGVERNDEANFAKQARMYADIMKLLLRFSDQVEAVQVWGIKDNMSWRATDFPLLFDAGGNPKSAFWAVIDPDGAW